MTFRFQLAEPTHLRVDRAISALQAEDATGRFGIRSGHEDFVTALVPGILVWRYRETDERDEVERFAAVRGGVLRVESGDVYVAVRSVQVGEDLDELNKVVRADREQAAARRYLNARSIYQMQLAAWRRLMEYEDGT